MGRKEPHAVPNWDLLYEAASAQEGYFTTAQAIVAGYSSQLLHHYVKIHRMERARRGIYRLVHYPPADKENLVVLWLWSERMGTFSHETALVLHGLSDALPARVHLTLPLRWQKRRLRVPKGLSVYFNDVPKESQAWHGPVPITAPAQTVIECAVAMVAPELVRQAIEQGLDRGLFTKKMIKEAISYGYYSELREPLIAALEDVLHNDRGMVKPVTGSVDPDNPCAVLVIDDEEKICRALVRVLEGLGCRTRQAADGVQGLELVAQEVPDLILLDLVMPNMNGPQFLEELRKTHQDLPVVVVTAYPDSELMAEAMKHGPLTLLSKPFEAAQVERVVTLLVGARLAANPRIEPEAVAP